MNGVNLQPAFEIAIAAALRAGRITPSRIGDVFAIFWAPPLTPAASGAIL